MVAAIYARVSTKDQSCELQLRDLRTYCAVRGFDLVREYVDVGQSGAKDSRPELNILMGDARKRQFDAIVVWRFDRFARSKIRPRYEWVRRRKTFTAHKKDFAAVSAC